MKLSLEIDGMTCDGLINQKDFEKVKDKDLPLAGTCDSSCLVTINDIEFTVLWEWDLFEESKEDCDNDTDDSSEISCISETDMSDTSIEDVNLNVTSDDSDDDIVHHTTF